MGGILLKDEIRLILTDYKRRSESGDISENTYKVVLNAYENLSPFWEKKSPQDISKESWAEFQDYFENKAPGASQFNVKKYFTVLVKHLVERELIKQKIAIKDRFSRREKNQRRKNKNWVYTSEEIQALDKACRNDLETAQVRLAYLMGFRISDVVQLVWERVITTGKYTYVEFSGSDDKAGTIARCPMPQSILDLLLRIPKTSRWVFPQKNNREKHIKTQQIKFDEIKKRAAITKGSFHSLRHFCLSRDFKNPKLTTAQVCKMRRVSLQVAHEHYIHVNDDDMALMIQETK